MSNSHGETCSEVSGKRLEEERQRHRYRDRDREGRNANAREHRGTYADSENHKYGDMEQQTRGYTETQI